MFMPFSKKPENDEPVGGVRGDCADGIRGVLAILLVSPSASSGFKFNDSSVANGELDQLRSVGLPNEGDI
jgi:hypothetical protein